MKREDLIKLGIAEDMVDKIMALHGSDIESHKTKQSTTEAELKTAKDQLIEANKQIESFKGMDIEGVKKTADEWKSKAEQAAKDAADQVAKLKFDHALDGALTGAKAKNPKAVRALLDTEQLKFNDADGSIIGLKDQLEKIQKENDYLFASDDQPPTIVLGSNNQSVHTDAFEAAMLKGAGIQEPKTK